MDDNLKYIIALKLVEKLFEDITLNTLSHLKIGVFVLLSPDSFTEWRKPWILSKKALVGSICLSLAVEPLLHVYKAEFTTLMQ